MADGRGLRHDDQGVEGGVKVSGVWSDYGLVFFLENQLPKSASIFVRRSLIAQSIMSHYHPPHIEMKEMGAVVVADAGPAACVASSTFGSTETKRAQASSAGGTARPSGSAATKSAR